MLGILRNINARLAAKGFNFRRIANVSLFQTALASIRLRQGLRILIFRQTRVSIKGHVLVDKHSLLAVNEPWTFSRSEPGSLIVLRNATLRVSGGEFAIKSGAFVEVKEGAHLEFQGGRGYASRNLQIECRERITIGPGAAIAADVIIRDNDGHPLTTTGHLATAPVTIGRKVWIGTRCIILKGVTIGDGAVIAAGSIVTNDIPANCIAAGTPARVVRAAVSWT